MPYEYQVHSIAICLIPSTKKWISLLWKVSQAELITNHDVQMIESTCFVNLISLVWPTKKWASSLWRISQVNLIKCVYSHIDLLMTKCIEE